MTSLVLAEAPDAETPAPAAAPPRRTSAGGAATPDAPAAEAPAGASPEPPRALESPPAPEPPPAAPPPPSPVSPPPVPGSTGTAPASREPPAIDRRPPRLTTGAGIAGGAGLLPRMAAGAEVHIALAIAPFPTLFASATIWRSQSEPDSQGSDSGSTLGLWLAGLGLCPIDHRWTTRSFSACLGGEVGRLHAAGVGFPQAFDQDHWAADVTTGARVRQAIDGGGFYLAAAVRLAVPLLRGRILFGDANGAQAEIFRMWPVAVIAGLEAGYAFK